MAGSARDYVVATDPRAGKPLSASVAALQPASAAWGGTMITVSLAEGLGFSIPLDLSVQDNASVIDALNQSPVFRSHFLADESALGHVRVRTRAAGATAFVHVRSSLAAAFGPAGRGAVGHDPDVCVADNVCELRDLNGRPIPALVSVLKAGHFRERSLIALTPAARIVLTRRGSLFS